VIAIFVIAGQGKANGPERQPDGDGEHRGDAPPPTTQTHHHAAAAREDDRHALAATPKGTAKGYRTSAVRSGRGRDRRWENGHDRGLRRRLRETMKIDLDGKELSKQVDLKPKARPA
jgi:hypothetical protein